MPSIKKILNGRNYLVIYLFLILIYNLILINLPLSNILGYEFSALNSVLLTILSGLYSISFFKSHDEAESFKHNHHLSLLKILSIFLIVPFLTGFIKSLLGVSCSLLDGVLFYLVLTVPSILIGASLGILCYALTKYTRLLFLLFILIIAAIPVAEIYFYPQIYFYNPLIGFFPGTIYDEGLSVNIKLIAYRVLNIIFFLSIIIMLAGRIKKNIFKPVFVLLYSFCVALIFFFLSPWLGYSTSEKSLESELKGTIETEHFVIKYSKKIDAVLIKASALHHEFYYSELSKFFDLTLREKITSYVFKNSEQKGELFGAENADVAKPWLLQIYTTPENYNSTLKHEIAHIFAGEFSSGIFKVPSDFNPGLIEGIASAAHPVYDENNIDFLAAAAYKYGYKTNIKNVFTTSGFFSSVSTISYVYAGSFIKYLVDNYGIQKFKVLYNDPDFTRIYGRSIKSLEKGFYSFLEKINVEGAEDLADFYFGRKTIFQKVCPRYVSDRISKASALFSNGEYYKASEIFEHLYSVSRSYAPLSGLISSLIKMNQLNRADSILSSDINDFTNTGYYYNLELKLADLWVLRNDYSKADSLYSRLVFQNPNYSLFYLGNMRRELLSRENILKLYLRGNELDKYLILKEYNKSIYAYSTLPVLVDLSRILNEEYQLFLMQFNKTPEVTSFSSAYAVLKLSELSLEKLDFEKARRMAALTLRYKEDKNLNNLLEENFRKTNWFRYNARDIIDNLIIHP